MTWDVYDLSVEGDEAVRGHVAAEGVGAAVEAVLDAFPDILAIAIAPRGSAAPGRSGLILSGPASVMLVDGVMVIHAGP